MAFPRPSASLSGGNASPTDQATLDGILDTFADALETALRREGLVPTASPVFRPTNVAMIKDPTQVQMIFGQGLGGLPDLRTFVMDQVVPLQGLVTELSRDLSWNVYLAFSLPLPDDSQITGRIAEVVDRHVADVLRDVAL